MPTPKRAPWMPERKAHARRLKPNSDVYNKTQWRNLARRHKMANPICVLCEANGITSPVEVTDHISPINEGGTVYDWDNLQSLCHRCHNSKSGKEARRGRQ